MSTENLKTRRIDSLFCLKYAFVIFVGCLLMLSAIFYQKIQHDKRVDAIFDKYEQDMNDLHEEFNY